jgi:hypothetical protein
VIKYGSVNELLLAQTAVLKLFISLEPKGKSEYRNALMLNLIMLTWLRKTRHPVWDMLCCDVTVLNEEKGESSLSVLARALRSKSIRSDCSVVNNRYFLTRSQMMLARELKVDLSCSADQKWHGRRVDADGDDVTSCAMYFKGVVRSMRAGTWRHYDTSIDVIKDAKHGAGLLVDPVDVRVWLTDSSADSFTAAHATAKSMSVTFWATQFSSVWPSVADTHTDSNDELVDVSPDDDDDRVAGAEEVVADQYDDCDWAIDPPDDCQSAGDDGDQVQQPPDDVKSATQALGQRVKKKRKRGKARKDKRGQRKKKKRAQVDGKLLVPVQVMDEREGDDGELYLSIRWKGFPQQSDWSWEPITKFLSPDYADLLSDYGMQIM